MKILSITAQKPNSTGSGMYLMELVKGFTQRGHVQSVVGGMYLGEETVLSENTILYPCYFQTETLPFSIPGMSDEMPYESTVYSQMSDEMVEQFKEAFYEQIKKAIEQLEPDIILCHHLYLLTACVRRWFPQKTIVGICHGTDLRQLKKNPLFQQFIKENIRKLDYVFALQEAQKNEIQKTFAISEQKIEVVGVGYNHHYFYWTKEQREDLPKRIFFAGKISKKKGVASLIQALNLLPYNKKELEVQLAGGAGNQLEYNQIKSLAQSCKFPVEFVGMLSQKELANRLRKSHLFVLPSFYEGLPLVLAEALACGTNVICNDLPGVKEWMDRSLKDHDICFVDPPKMENTDEPVEADLIYYESRLADAIKDMLKHSNEKCLDIESLSWEGVCETIEHRMKIIIEKNNKA